MKVRNHKNKSSDIVFDCGFIESEQLPKNFAINFESVFVDGMWRTKVTFNGVQLGDIINDNSRSKDYYRFHDVFHLSFAAMLGWSPCTRAMMKRKRKSDFWVDEFEDGPRATITEEALSMFIFNEAKRKNFFKDTNNISKTTLRIIKEMTEDFEVSVRSSKEWEQAILKAYEIFRLLIANDGGEVAFDALNKVISYSAIPKSDKHLAN